MGRVKEVLSHRKERLSEEEYQTVKTIFHDVPQLDFLPKSLWIPVSQLLSLRVVQRSDKLVAREDPHPLCYIVLTGNFGIKQDNVFEENGENMVLLPPGTGCSNFQALIDKRWKPVDIVAVDEVATAAAFSPDALGKLLSIENSNAQFKALLVFLTESIPKFDQLSGHLKERLCRFFKEVVFLPGKEIIQEGSSPSSAYLIREGTCAIMSRENPLAHPSLQKNSKAPANILMDSPKITSKPAPIVLASPQRSIEKMVCEQLSPAKTLRGYMSISTNMYQLRTVSEREWFGEETLIVDEVPRLRYEYSVVSRNRVVALEITRESLKKFPSEVLNWFKRNARSKLRWHTERKMELAESIDKIYQMDPLTGFLDEAFLQVTKKFPQASPQLTAQLHKHNFLSDETEDRSGETPAETVPDLRRQPTANATRARPKSGVLPTFNNLRVLMNTKKRAAKRPPQLRPMSAAQSMPQFPRFTQRSPPATAATVIGAGYRSAAQFFQSGVMSTRGLTAGTRPTFSPTRRKYEDLVTEYKKVQPVYLEAASTFRMSYDRKAFFPTMPPKKPATKKGGAVVREEHEDSVVERLKLRIEDKYDTFKVGIRDVKAVDTNAGKRPSSPNPVKTWAARNKVDIALRNSEIKSRMALLQQPSS